MEKEKKNEHLDWEAVAKAFCDTNNSQQNQGKAETNPEKKQLQQMLQQTETWYQARKFNSKHAWNNVYAQMNPEKAKTIRLKQKRKEVIAHFYKYAAIVIVALLLGAIGYYAGFVNRGPAIYNEIISAENQVLTQYVLPDGSVVALNSNSQLQFPKKFKGDVREVTIVGEAFFDVKPNPEKPFIIHAGNAQVKVLGTSFNVCAYPDTNTIEVIVESGKVQVINNNHDLALQEVYLTPGEKGIVYVDENTIEKLVNTDPNFISWKTHDLVFNKVPLHEVVRCLEKTYHIDIEITEPELNNLLYEGHFNKKPLDFVLDVIRLTFNLELTVENELYTLSSRNNEQVKL
jgi:ferric-dicitrate binding protein FerR (iron transport regulator)